MSHMRTFNIRHPVLLSLLRQLVHTQQFKFTNKAFKVYLCNLIKAFLPQNWIDDIIASSYCLPSDVRFITTNLPFPAN